ncbi:hypothetical protein AN478_06475 [Thiohalorhabdus denitrificans]|uniref:Biotin transport system permease protein n=1 Tax=Thiohalorhabdus denitrificans TaxID=381306 RepID=A0A0P9EDM2_9GAMM|nr:hypothetical protein [Thiohalorhabdus denitrificans]KPV40434.1 hypothetical protein AN478_06475 [Thiohalorhabdus denitrificans]SCY60697.1 biotin transport system permease protein [Thiohalorhabdus denitrificans]
MGDRGAANGNEGLHAGGKVLAVLLLALGLTLGGGLAEVLATALPVALALLRSPGAGGAFLLLLRRLRVVFLFILILHGWFSPGVPLFTELGAWSPSRAGLVEGVRLVGVVGLMAAMVAALVRTTPVPELAGGVAWVLRPLGHLGVPVERFGRLLAWTVERVEPVRRETGAVRQVLRLRRPSGRGLAARLGQEAAAARVVLRRAREAADRNAEALYLRRAGGVRPPGAPDRYDWGLMVAAGTWGLLMAAL